MLPLLIEIRTNYPRHPQPASNNFASRCTRKMYLTKVSSFFSQDWGRLCATKVVPDGRNTAERICGMRPPQFDILPGLPGSLHCSGGRGRASSSSLGLEHSGCLGVGPRVWGTSDRNSEGMQSAPQPRLLRGLTWRFELKRLGFVC